MDPSKILGIFKFFNGNSLTALTWNKSLLCHNSEKLFPSANILSISILMILHITQHFDFHCIICYITVILQKSFLPLVYEFRFMRAHIHPIVRATDFGSEASWLTVSRFGSLFRLKVDLQMHGIVDMPLNRIFWNVCPSLS